MLFSIVDMYYIWLMVLPFWEILLNIIIIVLADVIAFNSIGRCYCQWIVADDMPLRLMLLPIVY